MFRTQSRRYRLANLIRRAERRFWELLADPNATAEDCETVLVRQKRAAIALANDFA